jgi:excinuclease ABC subunit B
VVDPRSSEHQAAQLNSDQQMAMLERSPKEISKEITRLEKQMLLHARNLEFEKAAQMRDQLGRLKEEVFGVDKVHDSIEKAFV